MSLAPWLQASLDLAEVFIFESLNQLEKIHQQVLEKNRQNIYFMFRNFRAAVSDSNLSTSSSACCSRATAYRLTVGLVNWDDSNSRESSTSIGLHFPSSSSACLASWGRSQFTHLRNFVKAWWQGRRSPCDVGEHKGFCRPRGFEREPADLLLCGEVVSELPHQVLLLGAQLFGWRVTDDDLSGHRNTRESSSLG